MPPAIARYVFLGAAAVILAVALFAGTAGDGTAHPPGVTAAGIANHTVLYDAHRATLQDTAYTMQSEQVIRADTTAIPPSRVVRTNTVLPGGTRYRLTYNQTGGLSRDKYDQTWANGTHRVQRVVVHRRGQQPQQQVRERPMRPAGQVAAVAPELTTWLERARFGTVRRTNTTIVLADAELVDAAPRGWSVTRFDATLHVTPGGRIVNASLSWAGTLEEVAATAELAMTVEETDETDIPRPQWLPASLSR